MTKIRRSPFLVVTLSLLVIGLLAGLVVVQFALWYSDLLNREINLAHAQSSALQSIWFDAHRIDDFLHAYATTGSQSQRAQLVPEVEAWSNLLSASLPQLRPLPSYGPNQEKIVQRLRQEFSATEVLDDRVVDLSKASPQTALNLLYTPAAMSLAASLHHDTDSTVALINAVITRDSRRISNLQYLVRILLAALILVSVVTVLA